MGIIQRQGLKRSILTYIGVGIGAFSTIFIYPRELEAFGIAQFLISAASFFATFAAFGVNALPVRFFPVFENPSKRHHGFLGLLLWIGVLGMIVFWGIAWVFQDGFYYFLGWIGFDISLFKQNMLFIFLICFAQVISSILDLYTSNFRRVAIPAIFTNLFQKIGLPLAILMLFKELIGDTGLKWSLVGIYVVIGIGLALYLKFLGEWNVRPDTAFLTPFLTKEMFIYAMFGILGSIASVIAFSIDTIMITSLTGALNSGIYNISYYIANVIEIPFMAIIVILTPIMAGALARDAKDEVEDYYKKGSLNLMILGILVFILAVTCMDDLFRLTSRYEELKKGREVVWYLGLSKVILMSFGISRTILGFSRYYRFALIPLMLLAGMNIVLNFVLIPKYQITGAAIATTISMVLFQVSNVVLVWYRIGIHPFTHKMPVVAGIGASVILAGAGIPSTDFPLVNIVIKGILVTVLFLAPVLLFRLSPELNEFLFKNIQKARLFPRQENH